MEVPPVIRAFVEAASNADGDGAGRLVTEDAVFRLSGDRELPPGQAGARAFAAKHVESDGRKASVVLVDTAPVSSDRWVMTVGGVFTLEGDRISGVRAFPSYEEAVAAAGR
jgi:limonene-1,2-epoxide hydrolase